MSPVTDVYYSAMKVTWIVNKVESNILSGKTLRLLILKIYLRHGRSQQQKILQEIQQKGVLVLKF